jgi:hypothetical protein
MAAKPGFTVPVILALAFAIGANTAVFAVVNSLLLMPLPFTGASELVEIEQARRDLLLEGLSRMQSVSGVAAFLSWGFPVGPRGEARTLFGFRATRFEPLHPVPPDPGAGRCLPESQPGSPERGACRA